MKLWLIWQDENNGYDTYDSAVVAAPDEESAKKIYPTSRETPGDIWGPGKDNAWNSSWSAWASSPEHVKATCIGETIGMIDAEYGRVFCASFNAG